MWKGFFMYAVKITAIICAFVSFVVTYEHSARLKKLEAATTCVQQPKDCNYLMDTLNYKRGYSDGLTWCRNALTDGLGK